jgi:hypothetical protein
MTRPLHTTKLKCEWLTFDVVQLCKEWCAICARQRIHEQYQDWAVCVVCGEQTYKGAPAPEIVISDAEQPGFQVIKFINDNV